MNFSIILAADSKNWIWKNNSLAWKLKKDMAYFKKITSETLDLAKLNSVIMWRKTWESVPSKFRPLTERINCILSKSIQSESIESKIDDFVLYFNCLEHCLDELKIKENLENIIIWWATLYNQVLNDNRLEKIYITRIDWDFWCDVFFNGIPKNFILESCTDKKEEKWIKFRFEIWKKIN